MEEGHTAEIAVVGNDGCVGVMLLLGGGADAQPRRWCKSPDNAYRIDSERPPGRIPSRRPIQVLLLRYVQTLITQITQTAVCYRHHSIEQQLCRWLLLSLDRLPTNEVRMTQELISNVLGVRRSGITSRPRGCMSSG